MFSRRRRTAAWLVHLVTASGAVLGLFSLFAIHQGELITAFWFIGIAIFVDAIDGTLARRARTKEAAPKIDGALLDNIIDYFNYVMVPAFFLLVTGLLPAGWALLAVSIMVLASAYQFTQPDAKTDDHFFKGFPCYWNIVIFYLFFWNTPPWTNLAIILFLSLLVFVPIKYVYPSRMEHLTSKRWLRLTMLAATLLWAVATFGMLLAYPASSPLFTAISMGYALFYFSISVYRTLVPLKSPRPSR